ncbi:MAG: serine/threonine protein kinase [Planctomycetes bacterium]|nr:serine/threonine protein kinase [Planctomycetota bacterium]
MAHVLCPSPDDAMPEGSFEKRFAAKAVEFGFLTETDLDRHLGSRGPNAQTVPMPEALVEAGALRADQVTRILGALAAEASTSSLVGEELGGYRIVERIGGGGMGELYKALDPTLEKHFAIKVILPEYSWLPGFVDRFREEAKLASRIEDPHVVPILRFGEERGLHFCVMPLVEGKNVAEFVKKRGRGLSLSEALAILAQAARGISAIHRAGIVHRDVKPENLLVNRQGKVLVTDFGLARDTIASSNLTAVGTVLGTPHYMSPEQTRGEPVDARTDVYSLGLTFYFLLAGAPPFAGENPSAVLQRQRRDPVPDPAARNPEARGEPARLLRWMTVKEPADRPASMEEVLEAIRAIGEKRRIQGPRRPIWRILARPALFAGGALFLAALAVGLAWAFSGEESGESPPVETPVARDADPTERPAPPVDDPDAWLADAEEFLARQPEGPEFRKRAIEKFREIVERFPGTLAASRARDRIVELETSDPARVKERLQALEDLLTSLVAERQFGKALRHIEDVRSEFSLPEWQEALGRAESETMALGEGVVEKLAEEAERRREAGDPASLVRCRELLDEILAGDFARVLEREPGASRAQVEERRREADGLVAAAWDALVEEVFFLLSTGQANPATLRVKAASAWGDPAIERSVGLASPRIGEWAGALEEARRGMWRGILARNLAEARAPWVAFPRPLEILGRPYPLETEEAPIGVLEDSLRKVVLRLSAVARDGSALWFRKKGEEKPVQRCVSEVRDKARIEETVIVYRSFQSSKREEVVLLDLDPGDLLALALGRDLGGSERPPPPAIEEACFAATLLLGLGRPDEAESIAAALPPRDRARILHACGIVREEITWLPEPGKPGPDPGPERPRSDLEEKLRAKLGPGARVLEEEGDLVAIEVFHDFTDREEAKFLFLANPESIREGTYRGGGLLGGFSLLIEWEGELEVEMVCGFEGKNNLGLGIVFFNQAGGPQYQATVMGDRPGPSPDSPPGLVLKIKDESKKVEDHLRGSPLRGTVKPGVRYTLRLRSRAGRHRVELATAGMMPLVVSASDDRSTRGTLVVGWVGVQEIWIDSLRVRGRLSKEAVAELRR